MDGDIPLFAEFKSYALETWQNIKSDSKFFNQFKNYIGSINRIDELAYIINTKKASEEDVKKAFGNMLADGDKRMEMFNAMKSELKQRLEIEYVTDLTRSKIDEILNVIIKEN